MIGQRQQQRCLDDHMAALGLLCSYLQPFDEALGILMLPLGQLDARQREVAKLGERRRCGLRRLSQALGVALGPARGLGQVAPGTEQARAAGRHLPGRMRHHAGRSGSNLRARPGAPRARTIAKQGIDAGERDRAVDHDLGVAQHKPVRDAVLKACARPLDLVPLAVDIAQPQVGQAREGQLLAIAHGHAQHLLAGALGLVQAALRDLLERAVLQAKAATK